MTPTAILKLADLSHGTPFRFLDRPDEEWIARGSGMYSFPGGYDGGPWHSESGTLVLVEPPAPGQCDWCLKAPTNPPVKNYYDEMKPALATWERLCDRCLAPREQPVDYAAPFADED